MDSPRLLVAITSHSSRSHLLTDHQQPLVMPGTVGCLNVVAICTIAKGHRFMRMELHAKRVRWPHSSQRQFEHQYSIRN